MITQEQYEQMVRDAACNRAPRVQDFGDLLESFEQLYEALDRCAASGARALGPKDFELLANDDGEPTVRLKKASAA